jgi:DNA repair protein RecO (recombination protein O)
MSTICKSPAIVLRIAPYSETSRVVTWLTPDHGRIATLIKGAQRPKSAFLGQFDLFYTCELLFYFRDARGVYIARECAPEKTRDRFRTDWKAAAAASYCTDVISRIALPDTPQPDLFDLLDSTLDTLAEAGTCVEFTSWFELKLLDALGLAPRLTHCLSCGKTLEPGGGRAGFAPARGGLLCASCLKQSSDAVRPIAPDVLAALLGWQRSRRPQSAFSTQTHARQMDEIENFLGSFLRHHLDLALPSRNIALDMMRRTIPHAKLDTN